MDPDANPAQPGQVAPLKENRTGAGDEEIRPGRKLLFAGDPNQHPPTTHYSRLTA